jgi:tRNA(fMet)-specific endonuclease VapC
VILDTNALSAFVDGDPIVGEILRTQDRAAIPVIVLGEFRYGILGSRHRVTYERWLDQHLARFETLLVTAATAVTYATVRAALKRVGTPIPANDLWIAALGVEHRLPVLSRDTHFDAVKNLLRVTW